MAVLLMGCDDVIFGEAEDGSTELPSQEGYPGVVEIVGINCYGCHSEAANAAAGFGLNLETDLHANTVGVVGSYGVPLVTPGSPEDSMLFLKITDANPDNTGGPMPPGGILSAAITDIVQAWIVDGAPAE